MEKATQKSTKVSTEEPAVTRSVRSDVTALHKYVTLVNEKAEIDDALKRIKAQMEILDGPGGPIISYFERHGLERTTIDGRTIYVQRELWAAKAEGAEWAQACDALVAAGLEDLVGPRFNAATLSAHFREMDKEGLLPTVDGKPVVPPEFTGLVNLSEVFKVRTRKG